MSTCISIDMLINDYFNIIQRFPIYVMMKSFFLILLLVIFQGPNLWAEVDVRNGNFYYSWVDGEFDRPNAFWQLQRTYNSRENRVGIFGHGWCSPLETTLTKESAEIISIQNCGSGAISKYLKHGDRWLLGSDEIISDSMGFTLKSEGVSHLQFDSEGVLLAFWIGEVRAHIEYAKTHLVAVEISGIKIHFKQNSQGLIKEVLFPNGEKSLYEYNGNDLVGMTNSWKNEYRYVYDSGHNLLNAKWPDGTEIILTYNASRDWVVSQKDRAQCTETYKYEVKKLEANSKVIANIEKKCPEMKSPEFTKFEMLISPENHLLEVNHVQGEVAQQIVYHAKFDKPVMIRGPAGVEAEFFYNENGDLLKKKTSSEDIQYKRTNNGKLSEIRWGKDKILKLVFDSRGRATELKLNSDKKVLVEYVEDTTRIKVLKVPGRGEIRYTKYGSIMSSKNTNFEDQLALQKYANEVYGLYSMAVDQAFIYGGLNE